ncbi:MAG: IS30 family transposase [Acholeplasmataceae bacterium]
MKKSGHITIIERYTIEALVKDRKSASEIANTLDRNEKTIRREIYNNRHIYTNETNKFLFSDPIKCDKLEHFPYTCHNCNKFKAGCLSSERAIYTAQRAQDLSDERKSESKTGVRLSHEEVLKLESIISDGIDRGIPIEHIARTNNLGVSVRTIYRYIEERVIKVNIPKMPLKVRRKPRKRASKDKKHFNPRFINKTYADYITFLLNNNIASDIQMDCVEGIAEDNKAILTIYHEKTGLFLGYILQRQTNNQVKRVLDKIERKLGYKLFKEIFPVILTDRGTEFQNYESLEESIDLNKKRTLLYYCDPNKPYQKGGVEQAHTRLRRFFPKGKSIDWLTQSKLNLVMSQINSITTNKAGGLSPYELFSKVYGEAALSKLGLEKIENENLLISFHKIFYHK